MRPGLIVLGLAAIASRTALAQERAEPDTLLDRSFTASPGDSAVIDLGIRRWYRAELFGAGVQVALTRPRARFDALVVTDADRTSSSHQVLEVYARESGPHVVRVAGLAPGDTIRVLLTIDRAGTAAGKLRADERARQRWALGLRAGVGLQGSFALSQRRDAGGGILADVGLRIASAGFPLSLVLGVSVQHAPESKSSVTWFYAEAAARLLRTSGFQVSLLAHLAQGNPSLVTIDPSYRAGGAEVIYTFSRNTGRRGLAVQGRVLYGAVVNVFENQGVPAAVFGLLGTF